MIVVAIHNALICVAVRSFRLWKLKDEIGQKIVLSRNELQFVRSDCGN